MLQNLLVICNDTGRKMCTESFGSVQNSILASHIDVKARDWFWRTYRYMLKICLITHWREDQDEVCHGCAARIYFESKDCCGFSVFWEETQKSAARKAGKWLSKGMWNATRSLRPEHTFTWSLLIQFGGLYWFPPPDKMLPPEQSHRDDSSALKLQCKKHSGAVLEFWFTTETLLKCWAYWRNIFTWMDRNLHLTEPLSRPNSN